MKRFLAAAALLALAGCGTTHAPGKPRVALVLKSLATSFTGPWKIVARAHQAAHAADYDLLAVGTRDEQDVAGQIRLVEQMVAERVERLVIAPADGKALVPACGKARAAGLVVVTSTAASTRPLSPSRSSPFLSWAPTTSRARGRWGSTSPVPSREGTTWRSSKGRPAPRAVEERRRGFEEAMGAAGIEIVASQAAHGETPRARQVAAALLVDKPGLRAFLCANDSLALGAVAALRTAGRRDVKVVCFGSTSSVQELVKEGVVLATADPTPTGSRCTASSTRWRRSAREAASARPGDAGGHRHA